MKTVIGIAIMLIVVTGSVAGQPCAENAKEIRPQLSKEAALKYSENLAFAAQNAATNPTVDNIIWHARRKGYLGRYKEAVEALTAGIKKFPDDARMYRHRGHRYITLRCFDDAVRDLERASKLIKGKPDEVEPDGAPNAKNIPTGTLQSNIWYHLGLAYYLKGDFKRAVSVYKAGAKVSKNNDMLAANSHWHYMALRRSGKDKEARRLLAPFSGEFELIENDDYLKLLRLYRGEITADALSTQLNDTAGTLGNASLGYGLGSWYLYNGDNVRAMNVFRKITLGNQWASFGFIAAEAELSRQ